MTPCDREGWSGWWTVVESRVEAEVDGIHAAAAVPGGRSVWALGLCSGDVVVYEWHYSEWRGGGDGGGRGCPDRLIVSLSRNVPEPAWSFTKGGLGWQSITSPSPELHHTPSLWTDTRTDDISSPLICPWPSVSYVSASVLVLFLFFLFLREPGHSVDSEDNWRTCSVIKWQFVYFCKVSFGLSED